MAKVWMNQSISMANQKPQPINSKIKSLLPEANPFPAENCRPLFVVLKEPNRRSLPFKTQRIVITKL